MLESAVDHDMAAILVLVFSPTSQIIHDFLVLVEMDL